ncbi:MAG: carboxypeptidase-like regulatory domain-containing protein [Pirellulaceae bacterium]
MDLILRRLDVVPVALFGVAILLSGCGAENIAGTTQINGVVTLDGAPVDQASVAFTGAEGARLATAQTDKAGKFTLRAALGTNVVTVAKAGDAPAAPVSSSDGLMPTDGEYQQMVKNQPKPGIPAKYSDPTTSGIKLDIKDGMPEVALDLSSK